VRLFLETPPLGATESPLLTFVQAARLVRFDFNFIGTSDSPLLSNLIRLAPGISKVFLPNSDSDILDALLSDAPREFVFQLEARLRAGVTYRIRYLPSVYLSSSENSEVVTIAVLPSTFASLSFEVIPPDIDERIKYQGMQCVAKFIRWNPKTNRLSNLIRIISQEFTISPSFSAVLDSISPSILFHLWVRELQGLPVHAIPLAIPSKLRGVAPIIIAHANLRPIVLMAFLIKSHPALSASFADRLTMGSLLSLSPPTAVDAQFSYVVEVWDGPATLVESGLRVSDANRKKDFIFVVKSFPNLFILSKGGRVAIEDGSPLDLSLKRFVEQCRPLSVKVSQTTVGLVAQLLAVDDEEGLPQFLQETGLERMKDALV
jgi:hypothetical protein